MWLLPFLSGISSFAARTFYQLQIVGPEVPASGPVLLLANHPNSLLDPALVAAAAGRPVRFLAKSTLFTDPRVGLLVRGSGAIPVYRRTDDPAAAARNVDMFEAVFVELGGGAAVGVFPEGISHNQPALARLKTGSARIALGAYSRYGTTFPLIPVGLVLREKGVFRSEALVIRGEPVCWEDLRGRNIDDQEAVRELTERVDVALRAVTVNLDQWEDQPLIDCAEAVWSVEVAGGGDEVEQLRRSQTAAGVLADLRRRGDNRWMELARAVDHHRRRLQFLGLTPADLATRVDLAAGAGWTIRRLHLLGPLAILLAVTGAIIFWVPFHLTDWIVGAIRPEEDQRSTYKVLIGAMVHLSWIVFLTALTWWILGAWAAFAVLVMLPATGLAGQWVRERWRGAWSDARRYLLLRSRQDLGRQLQEEQRPWRNVYALPTRKGRRYQGRASRSTLPPERMIPTLLPATSSSLLIKAATGTAADGSIRIFIRIHTLRIASMIACSSTVTIRLTPERIMVKVSSPRLVRRPSAMVRGGSMAGWIEPAASDRAASSAAAGSAPTMEVRGEPALAARTVPLSNPPPPTGARIRSKLGISSRSSLAAVPCPAMILGSLNG